MTSAKLISVFLISYQMHAIECSLSRFQYIPVSSFTSCQEAQSFRVVKSRGPSYCVTLPLHFSCSQYGGA